MQNQNKREIDKSYAFYDGYMQSEISNFLKLSSLAVSKIIRENE